jgi:hypothetical protein
VSSKYKKVVLKFFFTFWRACIIFSCGQDGMHNICFAGAISLVYGLAGSTITSGIEIL